MVIWLWLSKKEIPKTAFSKLNWLKSPSNFSSIDHCVEWMFYRIFFKIVFQSLLNEEFPNAVGLVHTACSILEIPSHPPYFKVKAYTGALINPSEKFLRSNHTCGMVKVRITFFFLPWNWQPKTTCCDWILMFFKKWLLRKLSNVVYWHWVILKKKKKRVVIVLTFLWFWHI